MEHLQSVPTPGACSSLKKRTPHCFADNALPVKESIPPGETSSSNKRAAHGSAESLSPSRRKTKATTLVVAETSSPGGGRKHSAAKDGERRLARFVSSPSAAVRQRIDRAFAHRLYLIDKKAVVGDPDAPSACEFFVLGATGNVYTVKLQKTPSCTCPDFARGNTCKHILFVMLRVLKLAPTDPRVWQKALLSSELNELLRVSSVNEAVLASRQVRQRFKEISGTVKDGEEADSKSVQRELDGDCPICYERMGGVIGKGAEPVVFCKTCGNNVHEDCFRRWSKSKGRGRVTCIYCRSPWQDGTKDKHIGKEETGDGGYVNLASYSDVHRREDTSMRALYPASFEWLHFRRR